MSKRKTADDSSVKPKNKTSLVASRKFSEESAQRLFCLCKQPKDDCQTMIQCETCMEWYHPKCVNLEEEEKLNMLPESWLCSACIDIMAINPNMSKEGLLRLQGRVTPKEGWGNKVELSDLSDNVAESHALTKRERQQGFMLFREEKILGIESNLRGDLVFFRASCDADRRPTTYNMFACFVIASDPNRVKWITCSCPAGVNGDCKHSVALLYQLLDCIRSGDEKLPLRGTCTSKLQMWHVKKPQSDEPLLFSDLEFVKHESSKMNKAVLGSSIRTFNVMPADAKPISKEKLTNFVKLFEKMNLNLPVIGTIKSNGCVPVIPKICQNSDLVDSLWEQIDKTADRERNESVVNLTENELAVLNSIKVNLACAKYVEVKTRLQSKSNYWHKQRSHRLTASMYGTFTKMKETTDPVKTFLQKRSFVTAKSLDHGLKYESAAFALFREKINMEENTSVGLIVNPKFYFLGASPDRLIKIEDQIYIVEIKCPYSIFKNKENIKNKAASGGFYLYLDETTGELELHKNSDVYHQIQGQLLVCNLPVCFLVVYVPPENIEILMITKNNDFINKVLYPKLTSIYYMHLLPYFAKEMFEKPSDDVGKLTKDVLAME